MKKEPKTVRKMLNYLEEFIDNSDFQSAIQELRVKLNIPITGLPLTKQTEKVIEEKGPFYIPPTLDKEKSIIANTELSRIIADFPVKNYAIRLGFLLYLFHNYIFESLFKEGVEQKNMVALIDLREETAEREGVPGVFEAYFKSLAKEYPMALLIRPEASRRDLADYVSGLTSYLERMRALYGETKMTTSKTRTRNPDVKARNAFIYENRTLPFRDIMRQANDKFPTRQVSYEYVVKIIAMEIKRRKKA